MTNNMSTTIPIVYYIVDDSRKWNRMITTNTSHKPTPNLEVSLALKKMSAWVWGSNLQWHTQTKTSQWILAGLLMRSRHTTDLRLKRSNYSPWYLNCSVRGSPMVSLAFASLFFWLRSCWFDLDRGRWVFRARQKEKYGVPLSQLGVGWTECQQTDK